ncbi:hypothetical protein EYZ11_004338 [Aspergillus tanneri]|uniref:Uncharacterized protein n=1 Tax=Aspergillus tanneri TaxID=1220188 RepID=A0A4S3JL84_9EURO|nr:hypothetical protein EYZ11_004338 [Aspergillus tanneri]
MYYMDTCHWLANLELFPNAI